MPRIDRYERKVSIPGQGPNVEMNPASAGNVGEAISKFGQAGTNIASGMLAYQEMEKKAERGVEAARLENNLKLSFDDAAGSFGERVDYLKFDEDAKTTLQGIKEQHIDKIEDNVLKRAAQRVFEAQSFSFLSGVRKQKARAITQEGQGQWQIIYDRALKDWVNDPTPEGKRAVSDQLQLKGYELVDRNILKPKEAEKQLQDFQAKGEEVYIRQIINGDPERALEELNNPALLPAMDPLRRQEILEHAEAKVRQEGSRLDKREKAVQRENQSTAVDMWGAGTLDLDVLNRLRARDPETDRPGLSDEFYTHWRGNIMAGKDVVTDPDTFNRLYLKDNLKYEDVQAEASRLNAGDQRTLMNRILQEHRDDIRDSRYYARQAEAERKVAEREEKSAAKEQQRIERERRTRYASDAKSYIKKAMNETGTDSKEGMEILKTFQGYVSDANVKPEDLPDMAVKLMESKKGGVIKWLKGVFFPDTNKAESPWSPAEEAQAAQPPAPVQNTQPAKPQGQRKSLDSIFGAKK